MKQNIQTAVSYPCRVDLAVSLPFSWFSVSGLSVSIPMPLSRACSSELCVFGRVLSPTIIIHHTYRCGQHYSKSGNQHAIRLRSCCFATGYCYQEPGLLWHKHVIYVDLIQNRKHNVWLSDKHRLAKMLGVVCQIYMRRQG